MRKIKIALILLLSALSCLCSYAQEIKVKSFSTIIMETMTQPMQRKDANGEICALVKVIIPDSKASFEGSLIGSCDYKTSEYWCYLSPESKQLKIKYPGCEPLMVNFEPLIGSGLKSKSIYELRIEVPIANVEKESFTIKGKVDFMEGDYPDKLNAIGGLHLDHTLYDGSKFQSLTPSDFIYNGGTALFEIRNVHIGDTLTISTEDLRFRPISSAMVVDRTRLRDSDFRFSFDKKLLPVKIQLIDSFNGQPIVGTICCKGGLKTDINGCATIPNLELGKECLLVLNHINKDLYADKYLKFVPGKNNDEVKGIADEIPYVFNLKRVEVVNYVKLNNISINEIDAYFDDSDVPVNKFESHGHVGFNYPVQETPTAINVKCDGYKTLRIVGKATILKMDKGKGTDVIEYDFTDRENVKKRVYKL